LDYLLHGRPRDYFAFAFVWLFGLGGPGFVLAVFMALFFGLCGKGFGSA
jgi:hypothetical protein